MVTKTVAALICQKSNPGRWVVLLLLLCSSVSFGQLKVRALQRTAEKESSRMHTIGRTKQLAPLSLPFFDDFSRPLVVDSSGLMFPDLNRWQSSYSVWINPGMAIHPPTINVATFDGLDSAGVAYNPNDVFISGFTDSLTSSKIDLSTSAAVNPVAESERNSVYISFFYQWHGNGEAPDEQDYLELLFKNDLGEWESAWRSPVQTFQRDLFYSAIVQVAGNTFFHNAFQFQIRSFGRQSGPFDTWNLDYVYLNKGRSATDTSFPDRAAASPLSPLFKPFSAMPYTHFLISGTLDSVRFDVQNLKNENSAANYKADIEYSIFKDGSPAQFTKVVENAKSVTPGFGLDPLGRVTVKIDTLPQVISRSDFDIEADSADVTLNVILASGDEADNKAPFEPYDLRINDTVSNTYHLRNFYAYDDGIAEYAVELIETGNFLAYRFDLPLSLPDTLALLEAIDIYFPPYGLPSTLNVDFYVFAKHATRDVPGARLLTIPSYRISNQGANQFQRIKFLPALALDTVNTFYIGWKQPISGKVLVGLDNSNDTGNKIFVNVEGNNFPDERNAVWIQNTTISGSLMIRPVFGIGVVDVTTGIEDEVKFAVYPNPSAGNFYIEGELDNLEILSTTGQRVSFQSETDQIKTFVQLHNASSGLYLLRCRSRSRTRTVKIVVNR